jgi:hypothetical protein
MKNDWTARIEAMSTREAKDCLLVLTALVNDGWEAPDLKKHAERVIREWGLDEGDRE